MQRAIPLIIALALFSCKKDTLSELQCPAVTQPLLDTIRQGYRFVLPTAFTPNGDGLNDTFRMITENGQALSSYELQVTDDQGNILHTMYKTSPDWDGIDPASGKAYPPGQYTLWFGMIQDAQGSNGLQIAADGFICITILDPDPRVRPLRDVHARDYLFGSQVDPQTMTVRQESGERIAP